MITLSDEQRAAVDHPGNVFVQACPGSGKTRVLTCRVIKGLEKLTLDGLRRQFGKPFHFRINTARDRAGHVTNHDEDAAAIFDIYHERLLKGKFLDYDDVLYSAYRLIVDIPEIGQTLSNIIRLI